MDSDSVLNPLRGRTMLFRIFSPRFSAEYTSAVGFFDSSSVPYVGDHSPYWGLLEFGYMNCWQSLSAKCKRANLFLL